MKGAVSLILKTEVSEAQGRRQKGGRQGSPCPPNRQAWPPLINKLTLLKTAAFVFNFELWPP